MHLQHILLFEKCIKYACMNCQSVTLRVFVCNSTREHQNDHGETYRSNHTKKLVHFHFQPPQMNYILGSQTRTFKGKEFHSKRRVKEKSQTAENSVLSVSICRSIENGTGEVFPCPWNETPYKLPFKQTLKLPVSLWEGREDVLQQCEWGHFLPVMVSSFRTPKTKSLAVSSCPMLEKWRDTDSSHSPMGKMGNIMPVLLA